MRSSSFHLSLVLKGTLSILNYTSSTHADKILKHRTALQYSLFCCIFNSYVDAYGTIYHKSSNYEDNNPPPENTKSLAKKQRKENLNLHLRLFLIDSLMMVVGYLGFKGLFSFV